MKKEIKNEKYTEVWGDTVVLKELLYSCVIGVFLTMSMFFLGQKIFHSFENIEKSLANGYALLIGVIGCIVSGAICAKLFRPKRTVEEKFEFENIEIIENKDVSFWNIGLVTIDGDENNESSYQVAGNLNYDDFIKKLPKNKYKFIDASYIMVEPLSKEEILDLLK